MKKKKFLITKFKISNSFYQNILFENDLTKNLCQFFECFLNFNCYIYLTEYFYIIIYEKLYFKLCNLLS